MDAQMIEKLAEKVQPIGAAAIEQIQALGVVQIWAGSILLFLGIVGCVGFAVLLRKDSDPTVANVSCIAVGVIGVIFGSVLLGLGIAKAIAPIAYLIGK